MNKQEVKFWLAKEREISKYEVEKHREQLAFHRKFLSEGKKCEKCGRKEMLTIDHIIPLKLLGNFGFNIKLFYDREDLRILCRPCNMLKSDHLDFSTPKTKKLLIKYLKNLC